MIIITTYSDKYFTLNGVNFAKIYQPLKQGLENIGLYNIYDVRNQIQNSEIFSQYEIDGTVYGTQAETIAALLNVIYKETIVTSGEQTGVNGIVSGYIEYLGGLTYRTVNLIYRLNNVLHSSNGLELTHDVGDALDLRTDVWKGNNSGVVSIEKGTPAEPILDGATELKLTTVPIDALGTTPSGYEEIVAYNENLQEAGGEFDSSTGYPSFIEFENTEQASDGLKSIKYLNSSDIGFLLENTVERSGKDISFIKLKTYLTTSGTNVIKLELSLNSVVVGSALIEGGFFNFDNSLLNQWQTVIIEGNALRALNSYVWGEETYNEITISTLNENKTLYFDEIIIQAGLEGQAVVPDHTHTNYDLLETITEETLNAEASTGTVLKLTNLNGVLYNMSSANSATTYTTTGSVLGSFARVLINAASEPSVTGAIKIKGSDFAAGVNMYLTVWNNGAQLEYWFEEIVI